MFFTRKGTEDSGIGVGAQMGIGSCYLYVAPSHHTPQRADTARFVVRCPPRLRTTARVGRSRERDGHCVSFPHAAQSGRTGGRIRAPGKRKAKACCGTDFHGAVRRPRLASRLGTAPRSEEPRKRRPLSGLPAHVQGGRAGGWIGASDERKVKMQGRARCDDKRPSGVDSTRELRALGERKRQPGGDEMRDRRGPFAQRRRSLLRPLTAAPDLASLSLHAAGKRKVGPFCARRELPRIGANTRRRAGKTGTKDPTSPKSGGRSEAKSGGGREEGGGKAKKSIRREGEGGKIAKNTADDIKKNEGKRSTRDEAGTYTRRAQRHQLTAEEDTDLIAPLRSKESRTSSEFPA
ncbi:hypothetical protein C8R45DRAFT_1081169 [Mycena sanguinolenta]|nr:hypothetical protein C8R45DRAFT_1081169 [Mycena sanguinolenta]